MIAGSRMTSHAQRLEGTQVVLVSPAGPPSTTTSQSSRDGEACGREHVGQHVDGQAACQNKGSREATPESHGVPWWAAHGVP